MSDTYNHINGKKLTDDFSSVARQRSTLVYKESLGGLGGEGRILKSRLRSHVDTVIQAEKRLVLSQE